MRTKDVINSIKTLSIIECAGVVGSYNNNPKTKNVDIIIISENKSLVISYLDDLFKVNHLVSDDTIQYVGSVGKMFSFLIHTKKDFENKVNQVISGNNCVPRICEWAVVGWLPESFLNDLSKMVIIKDNNNRFESLKESLQTMPNGLKMAIIDFSNKKISYLNKKIPKLLDDSIEKQICESEMLIHKVRKKYAEKGAYLHSFSRIDKEMLNE